MKKQLIIFFLLLTVTVLAQTKSKIVPYSKSLQDYGSVIKSEAVSKTDLLLYLEKCDQVMMFTFYQNKLIICDDNRNPLNYSGNLPNNQVYQWWGKTELSDFIKGSLEEYLTFEQRNKIKTFKKNDFDLSGISDNYLVIKRVNESGQVDVMEFSMGCPPVCSIIKWFNNICKITKGYLSSNA